MERGNRRRSDRRVIIPGELPTSSLFACDALSCGRLGLPKSPRPVFLISRPVVRSYRISVHKRMHCLYFFFSIDKMSISSSQQSICPTPLPSFLTPFSPLPTIRLSHSPQQVLRRGVKSLVRLSCERVI